jgi:cation diffusion facilitator CzcD-associated flavoprotein CzcO
MSTFQSSTTNGGYPLVVIGAGPVGLAAAAYAAERGMRFMVLEAGPSAGATVAEWSHVRLFSPWSELIDPAARRLLETTGWIAPDDAAFPTGEDWRAEYLEPLADLLDSGAPGQVRYDVRVSGVARQGRDRLVDSGRTASPFVVHVDTPTGQERIVASAVVDASGTWATPNPLGADGYPAVGEQAHVDRITYGIPDFRDPTTRGRFAGRHVAVAGRGASAQGLLIGLAELAEQDPETRVSWLLRRASVGDAFGGGDNDQLEQRGALGQQARVAATSGHVTHLTSFRTESVTAQPDGRLILTSVNGQQVRDVDEVIVVTGFRPDLSFLGEVRLDLDPVLSSARALAGEIDPSFHSCGDVSPHGYRELAHPEENLYIVGMKSYGRAPSFLAMTGFEQVRSVVAALDGDLEAAGRVELVLPETGVCGGSGLFDEPAAAGGCCGAPAAVEPELITLGRSPQ